jgi:hypothetical protein
MTCDSILSRLPLLMVAAAVVGVVAWASYQCGYRHAERAYQAEFDRATLREIVKDVDAIRTRLGRAPKDQAELESLLGRPMPHVHDEGRPTPVNYRRTGDNSFQLQYKLWVTDDWIFDSTKPDAGWVQRFY